MGVESGSGRAAALRGGEPVDMDRVRDVAMGDAGFLRELIASFLDDGQQQLQLLRQAIESEDARAVHRAAHRLKGGGFNFGARSLSDLCGRLEQLGKQGELDQAPALLKDIADEYARVEVFLTRLTI
jgi:HPt (histidine-containing phosphotransfer) domain-containing protein